MVIKIGRYISPPDIEAQLAPDNYLFTHSLMFTYDCYTQTGVNAAVKLNNSFTVLFGIHAGCDVAPGTLRRIPPARRCCAGCPKATTIRFTAESTPSIMATLKAGMTTCNNPISPGATASTREAPS